MVSSLTREQSRDFAGVPNNGEGGAGICDDATRAAKVARQSSIPYRIPRARTSAASNPR